MDGRASGEKVFTALFLFCGIGAGALGFLDAQVTLKGVTGRFRSVGGIDLDAVACKSFERLTKSPALCADLATMTGAELRAFAGDQAPDVVFMSPPCKGFSGLMSPKKAATKKYQDMNRLAVAGVELILDAWGDDGPGLLLLENVPRIATRGESLLKAIRAPLRKHRYVTHEGTHNCGKVGRLAQSRERFLMVARHAVKVPVFLYQPPLHPLRPCGEVLGTLPLPNDPAAGRLHRMPEITLRTWMRLAAIRPGKDWRDLESFDAIPRPAWARYTVCAFGEPTGAVAGSGTNGAWGVADVRVSGAWHNSVLGVVPMGEPFGTITGRGVVSTGAFALADLRVCSAYHGAYGVASFDGPSGTVTSAEGPSTGTFSVADLRLRTAAHPRCYGVVPFDAPAWTVTGNNAPGGSACSVADVRLTPLGGRDWYHHVLRVSAMTAPLGTVTSALHPAGGAPCIADLRITCKPWRTSGVLGVLAWSQPSYTVTASLDTWAGWAAVADPRVPSNPELAVWWTMRDLDAPPPFIPVIPGRGDGSWHRPLTLLERASLQGLPATIDGQPLDLEGTLSKISEHIGNAVPMGAAAAIAGEMLRTLILASAGAFMLSSGFGVWVKKARNGTFPLYVERQVKRVSKRARRRARAAVAQIARETHYEEGSVLQ